MPHEPVYLDHHSTTPCDPRVVEAMLPYFTDNFGNPASIAHPHGRNAAKALEDSRRTVSTFLGTEPGEIYFTSGATEANNLALRLPALVAGSHLVVSALEHKSVLEPVRRLALAGVEVTLVQPNRFGLLATGEVERALKPQTVLVSVLTASGEIGSIQPVGEIGALCRQRGITFHSDATQAVGKLPLNPVPEWCDLLSLSAHKFYGPKGVGALFVRRGVRLTPMVLGGGQERGLRSGTVPVQLVVGLARAVELRRGEMAAEGRALEELRNNLWDRIVREIDGASVNGPRELRLPGNLSVTFDRAESEGLIQSLRGYSISAGSACSTGDKEPSALLLAIGLDENAARSTVRIGLGRTTTQEQLDGLMDELKDAVARMRAISV